jgi:hypothetical protein
MLAAPGQRYVKLVEAGKALEPLRRDTLFHNPAATIFDVRV